MKSILASLPWDLRLKIMIAAIIKRETQLQTLERYIFEGSKRDGKGAPKKDRT